MHAVPSRDHFPFFAFSLVSLRYPKLLPLLHWVVPVPYSHVGAVPSASCRVPPHSVPCVLLWEAWFLAPILFPSTFRNSEYIVFCCVPVFSALLEDSVDFNIQPSEYQAEDALRL